MRYNLWLFLVLWWSLLAVLYLLPHPSLLTGALAAVGSFLLAAVVADVLVKAVVVLAPRRLVTHLGSRAVLVTGCSSGFGLRLAERLDALGVAVYAGVRDPQCQGARRLRETCSDSLHVVQLDVTKDDHVRRALDYVRRTVGDKELWAVVNNAGINSGCLVELTPVQDFIKVWDTNVFGGVRVAQAFMPLLRRSKGRLVFVNSSMGLSAAPGLSPYSSSKFGMLGFTESLRREVIRWGVSVHSVHPYFYRTSLTDLDKNIEMLEGLWRNCPPEVRDSYGEDYLGLLKKATKKFLVDEASSDIDEPVNDIIDAAIGATPKITYIPGWRMKFLYFLECHLPKSITDHIARRMAHAF